jgi:iron complex outermembrane receptor protein
MSLSAFAEHVVSLKLLTVTGGIMAFRSSDLAGFRVYPGIDVAYRLNNRFRLYSSANKTLRMPTFTDMFYKSPVQQGNPELNPEEALSFEGGIRFNNSLLKGYAGVFHRRGRNMIDWIKNSSADSIFWRSMNHTKINFTGFEGSLTFAPPSEESVISSVRLSCLFMKADSDPGTMLSKYALDYLAGQITASLDLRVAWNLYNSSRLTWQNRNGVFQDAYGKLTDYKSFWLSDTKFYWKETLYTIYAEASNIFNSNYFDFGGIIQPGFWLRGGVIIDLDYK